MTVRYILVICFLMLALTFSNFCHTPSCGKSCPKIEFLETEHEFGEVAMNEDVSFVFRYKSVGNQPLIISHVGSSCGCTTAQWSSKPLMTGKTGVLRVTFTPSSPGPFRKTIVVYSNAGNTPNVVLRIKGVVCPSQH